MKESGKERQRKVVKTIRQLTDWLPTTKKESQLRGWEELDVVLFSGDAYVDHPSFGCAVIGRLLESLGLRVAIVPQPDWHGAYRDFKKFGRPRLFFGISPGCMDSMVNKYTAAKRLRSEDAYSPDGRHDLRPDFPTIVYTKILKSIYPDVPVVLGGIEASLRRLTHYDYWSDSLKHSILIDSGADLLIYGMGEKPMESLVNLLADECCEIDTRLFRNLLLRKPLRQSAMLLSEKEIPHGISNDDIILHSHSACVKDKRCQAENFRHIEEESNKYSARRIIQEYDNGYVVVTPPYQPMSQDELDRSFDLPYTRLPHPKYRGKRIPAYDMIKHSVCLHRGCFGGCSFCTISAHQGKFITSRSKESIMSEIQEIMKMEDFKGYLSDLGGPSANMYAMHGRNLDICHKCARPSCLHPKICKNLNTDHSALLDIYRSVEKIPGIKKSFVGSGVRYDLILHDSGNDKINAVNHEYAEELIIHHVSGRLKVAPEHTSSVVLNYMRKPPFELFYEFKRLFDRLNRKHNLKEQIIPYFISSHPGCTTADMAELAVKTKHLDFRLEQIQDFTPTPMTVSSEMWYTGLDPYTLKPVFSAKSMSDKQKQRMFFFWYKKDEQQKIIIELKRIGRTDLINELFR